jgi:hypothetical protein
MLSARLIGPFAQRLRNDCAAGTKNPADIRGRGSARVIGQVNFRLGWKDDVSIEVLHTGTGRIEVAFVSEDNLTRSKQTGLVFEDFFEAVNETIGECERLGPRSNNGHVSAQNVPELRQLVQLDCSEDAAEHG